MVRRYVGAAVAAAGLVAVAVAGDWPQFRGPAGGVADGTPPAEWGADKNVRWKTEIPGVGWSSPVVVGGKVFLTAATSDKQKKPTGAFDGGFGPAPPNPDGSAPEFGKRPPPDAVVAWQLYCLDTDTGAVLWKKTAHEGKPAIPSYAANGYASETVVADAGRVYVHFATVGVFAFDHAGEQVWKKDLGAYPMAMSLGTGGSPAQDGERVFVVCDNEQQSFAVALDKKTGKEVWRTERAGKTAWSTPLVWANKVRTELVCCGSGRVVSYDPATGKVLWELGGIDTAYCTTPAADAERVYFGGGGPGSLAVVYAVKAGAAGDITLKKDQAKNEWVAWSHPRTNIYVASPLVHQGLVYVPGSRGTLSCFDAATGEPAYENERLPNARGVTASPWAAGDKVFVLDERGTTHVVQAGKKFEPLGTSVVGEMCWSTPAAVGGRLYLRGRDHLYCFEEKK
jgi:outer membrane protein assembly factor BamB